MWVPELNIPCNKILFFSTKPFDLAILTISKQINIVHYKMVNIRTFKLHMNISCDNLCTGIKVFVLIVILAIFGINQHFFCLEKPLAFPPLVFEMRERGKVYQIGERNTMVCINVTDKVMDFFEDVMGKLITYRHFCLWTSDYNFNVTCEICCYCTSYINILILLLAYLSFYI